MTDVVNNIANRVISIDIMSRDGILLGSMRIVPEQRYFAGMKDGKKVVRVSQLRATVIDRRPTLRGRDFSIEQNGYYYEFKYE